MPKTLNTNTLAFDNYAQFGNAVRQVREGKGLTQIELAKKAGVGSNFVRNLEMGMPSLGMDKISNVLESLSINAIIFSRPAKRKK